MCSLLFMNLSYTRSYSHSLSKAWPLSQTLDCTPAITAAAKWVRPLNVDWY